MISTSNRSVPLVNSIAFRSMLVLIIALFLLGGASASVFLYWQSKLIRVQTFETNEGVLNQAMLSAENQLDGFKDRLTLLATTASISDLDPVEASRFLKGYNVSPLFIPGEYVTLYNGDHVKLSDNSMVGKILHYQEFHNFERVTPQRPYVSPLFWEQNTPKKYFAVAVENRATANGCLTASFSFRRLWEIFENYKVGTHGYFVLFDKDGTILFHPNLRQWVATPHTAEDLGLHSFDPIKYKVSGPTYVNLSDGKEYFVNYLYDPSYQMGIMALQPRSEVESLTWKIGSGIALMALLVLCVIIFLSIWLVVRVGRPLNRLISRVLTISRGNYDMEAGTEIINSSNDEVHVLAQVFEEMRKTIKTKILELAEHKAHLEMEVMERTRELEKANNQLQQISRTDELTGLPNRRDIREKIDYEMHRSQRSQKPFTFIFIDIDKFKDFNDTYGHVCGDLVLQTVSKTMRNQLRKHDFIARWGGEEFLAVLPETDLTGAALVAERFRMKVSETEILFGGCQIRVTITLGVSLFDYRLGMDRSIDLADRALYTGKQSGRNQVVVFNPQDITEEDLQAAEMEKRFTAELACPAPSRKQPPSEERRH